MSSREALTQAVVVAGRQLVQAGHLAAGGVATRVQQLESAVGCLRAEATRRRLQLQQAREAQQFLTEVRCCSGAGRGGAGRDETRCLWGSRLSVCLLPPPLSGLLPPSSSFCKLPRSRASPSLPCYFVLLFLLNWWFSVIAFHQKDLEPLRNADTHVPFQSKSESVALRARHRGRQSSWAGWVPPS